MSLTHPTDIIGESITCWDSFYSNNYKWLFCNSLKIMGNKKNAEQFTEKVLLNILFKNPELVVSQNQELFKAHVYATFPKMFKTNDKSAPILVNSLIKKYYCQN